MLKLNLPEPSSELLTALSAMMDQELPEYVPGYEYLRPGVADGFYFISSVSDIGKKQFQPLFDEDIHLFGMMIIPYPWNLTEGTEYVSSYYRPHCDANRTFGLNYILNSGGDNVTTTMYAEVDDSKSMKAKVCEYEDVTSIRSYLLQEKIWYGLDAMRYHSVDNIQRPRLLLSISFTNLTLSDFIIKYSHLVDSVV